VRSTGRRRTGCQGVSSGEQASRCRRNCMGPISSRSAERCHSPATRLLKPCVMREPRSARARPPAPGARRIRSSRLSGPLQHQRGLQNFEVAAFGILAGRAHDHHATVRRDRGMYSASMYSSTLRSYAAAIASPLRLELLAGRSSQRLLDVAPSTPTRSFVDHELDGQHVWDVLCSSFVPVHNSPPCG
jgi:hypothetical protein